MLSYRKRKYEEDTSIINPMNEDLVNSGGECPIEDVPSADSANTIHSDDNDFNDDDDGRNSLTSGDGRCVIKSLSNSPPTEELQRNRAHHNELERRRRDHIKIHFNILKSCIPLLEGEKSSRALILKRAVDYIKLLQTQLKEATTEITKMKNHNDVLSRATSILSSTQCQVTKNTVSTSKLDCDELKYTNNILELKTAGKNYSNYYTLHNNNASVSGNNNTNNTHNNNSINHNSNNNNNNDNNKNNNNNGTQNELTNCLVSLNQQEQRRRNQQPTSIPFESNNHQLINYKSLPTSCNLFPSQSSFTLVNPISTSLTTPPAVSRSVPTGNSTSLTVPSSINKDFLLQNLPTNGSFSLPNLSNNIQATSQNCINNMNSASTPTNDKTTNLNEILSLLVKRPLFHPEEEIKLQQHQSYASPLLTITQQKLFELQQQQEHQKQQQQQQMINTNGCIFPYESKQQQMAVMNYNNNQIQNPSLDSLSWRIVNNEIAAQNIPYDMRLSLAIREQQIAAATAAVSTEFQTKISPITTPISKLSLG